MRVLVIEDDRDTLAYIAKGLEEAGHVVDRSGDGKDGLFMALEESYDAIVVDRMLPGLDGLSIVQSMRAARNRTPVLIIGHRATQSRVYRKGECRWTAGFSVRNHFSRAEKYHPVFRGRPEQLQ